MDDSQRQLIRHVLATIAYRTAKALQSAPPGFGGFEAGRGVRTPRALLNHMRGRILYVQGHVRPEPTVDPPPLAWRAEVTAFSDALVGLDADLAAGLPLTRGSAERLLQGPLSDVMTHVGQLAMLRRLAGSPIPPESFYDAMIETGRVAIVAPPP